MMTPPITDLPSVISLIPQRPPMVMVDALLSYTSTTGAAGLTIAADNLFVLYVLPPLPLVVVRFAQKDYQPQ